MGEKEWEKLNAKYGVLFDLGALRPNLCDRDVALVATVHHDLKSIEIIVSFDRGGSPGV